MKRERDNMRFCALAFEPGTDLCHRLSGLDALASLSHSKMRHRVGADGSFA